MTNWPAPTAAENLLRFERFAEKLGLTLEPWERLVLLDLFAGVREIQCEIPKGNGKSGLFAGVGLWHLGVVRRAYVPLFASTKDQAALIYESIEEHVKGAQLAKQIKLQPGYKTAKGKRLGGRLKVYSSDAGAAHGPSPSLVLLDEYWAHRDNKLYTAGRSALGKFHPHGGQLLGGTTAGDDEGSPLGLLRERWQRLPVVERPYDDQDLTIFRSEDGAFVAYQWEVPEGVDAMNPDVLKRVNPSSFVSRTWLAEQVASPSLQPFEIGQFHGNVWVQEVASWLGEGAWESCEDPEVEPPADGEAYLGVDIGEVADSSAVVLACPLEDGRVVVRSRVFDPPGGGLPMSYEDIENHIRELAERYQVMEVAYDPFMFGRSAQTLSDEGLLMVKWPQRNENMAPASAQLFDAISNGRLVHDGDRTLTRHVANGAVQRLGDRGWRIVRRGKGKIDALVALLMAHAQADQHEPDAGMAW